MTDSASYRDAIKTLAYLVTSRVLASKGPGSYIIEARQSAQRLPLDQDLQYVVGQDRWPAFRSIVMGAVRSSGKTHLNWIIIIIIVDWRPRLVPFPYQKRLARRSQWLVSQQSRKL